MTDIFIRNLREVRESALNSCGHTADDGTHYTEERERARSREQQRNSGRKQLVGVVKPGDLGRQIFCAVALMGEVRDRGAPKGEFRSPEL